MNLLLNFSALVGQGLAYSKLYLCHLVCVLSFPQFLKKLKDTRFTHFKKIYPLFCLLILMALSVGWSEFKFAGVFEVLQLVLGVYVVTYNITTNTKKSVIERALLIATALDIAICLGESFQLFRYPFSQYSEWAVFFKRNFHDWSAQNVDIPTGLHWNPNNNSFFLLIFAPIIFSLLKTHFKVIYLMLCSFIFYKTGSKALLIGWGSFLIFAIFNLIKLPKISIGKKIAFLSGLLMCGLISINYSKNNFQNERYAKTASSFKLYSKLLPEIFFKRMQKEEVSLNFLAEDSSLHERLIMLDGLFMVIAEHPLIGVGAGGLSNTFHTQAGMRSPINTPHFYLLEIWAKFGIFFLLVYLYWFFSILLDAWKRNRICFYSLLIFFIFTPVISTISYFLPQWVLYSYALANDEVT